MKLQELKIKFNELEHDEKQWERSFQEKQKREWKKFNRLTAVFGATLIAGTGFIVIYASLTP